MLRKSHLLAVAALTLAMPLGYAVAQDAQSNQQDQQQTSTSTDDQNWGGDVFGSVGKLTIDQLGDELAHMSVASEPVKADDGSTFYRVTVSRTQMKITLGISISRDQSAVWMVCAVTHLSDPSKVSTAALLKLMQLNFPGPESFSYVPDEDNAIVLSKPIMNNNVNGLALTVNLNNFCNLIQKTQDDWKPETLMPDQSAAVSAWGR